LSGTGDDLASKSRAVTAVGTNNISRLGREFSNMRAA